MRLRLRRNFDFLWCGVTVSGAIASPARAHACIGPGFSGI